MAACVGAFAKLGAALAKPTPPEPTPVALPCGMPKLDPGTAAPKMELEAMVGGMPVSPGGIRHGALPKFGPGKVPAKSGGKPVFTGGSPIGGIACGLAHKFAGAPAPTAGKPVANGGAMKPAASRGGGCRFPHMAVAL